jgi:hypothetical protein
MTRGARILSSTFSALFIRPHHLSCVRPLPNGRALSLSAAGRTPVRPLATLRTSPGKMWERALVGLLLGLLGLLSWQGLLVAGSPPDLPRTVAGAATCPSLPLRSVTAPALTHRGNSPPAMVAGLVSPSRDRMVLEADDLNEEDSPASLAVLTVGALPLVPHPAGRCPVGENPPCFWPFRYLTRPQLLKRFSPLS